MDVNHRIREIFDAAVDLPKERRPEFLLQQCGDDRGLYDEIARLIDAYEANVESDGGDLAPGRLLGFGAYEIVRELGHGGMGAVYLARRVDGTFDRQVAVKVIRTDRGANTALERFTRERRLLARVQHPGIATLFDAGSTEDGLPYFVMEYVDGLIVTEYCDRKRLDVRSRVILFQQICDAVACAHRVPIVHCDLKPANILVDADGRPRVLDFGIATALTRGGQEAEPPLDPYGSPRYASPEQMRGEPLQTTSDIYSLGVVLHELLVGEAPPATMKDRGPTTAVFPSALLGPGDQTATAPDAQSTIAGLRGTSVDTLRAQLSGDLDAIVAKCVHRAAERRYATVDALQEDLRRWLQHEPVSARPRTFGYVASRFVRRNPTLVAMATALLLILLVGSAVVTYQWRAAVNARRLAERRFGDVRQLATSLFDVDNVLAGVAGTTDARQAIVENASRYLDRLGQDAHNDPALSLELAESYRRVGDMLGNPNAPNLGDRAQALQKYDVAATHVVAASRQRPDDPAVRLAEARVGASRAEVLLASRRLPEARQAAEQSLSIVQALLNKDPDSAPLRQMLARIYRSLGDVLVADGKPDEALKKFEQARALDMAVKTRNPTDPDAQRWLALSQLRVAEALGATNQKAEAIAAFDEASQILSALSEREPAKVALTRDLAVGHLKLARLFDADNDSRARVEIERALETFRSLARLDPRNAGAQRDLLAGLLARGDIVGRSDPAAARDNYREALRIAEMLHGEPFQDPQAGRDLRIVLARLSAPPAPSSAPELKLAVVRNGAEVAVDKRVMPPSVGEDVRLSWQPAAGKAQYLLVMGGSGRARLFSRAEIAAAGWRVRTSGPPPSETLLLLTLPRPLAEPERAALIDRVSQVPGPRQIPSDAHILWRSDKADVIDTTVTTRGVSDVEWTTLVRTELERFPGLRFSGRTFPLAAR